MERTEEGKEDMDEMNDIYYVDGIDTDVPEMGPLMVKDGVQMILRAWAGDKEATDAQLISHFLWNWPASLEPVEEAWPEANRPKVLALMREQAAHIRDTDPNWTDRAFHGNPSL